MVECLECFLRLFQEPVWCNNGNFVVRPKMRSVCIIKCMETCNVLNLKSNLLPLKEELINSGLLCLPSGINHLFHSGAFSLTDRSFLSPILEHNSINANDSVVNNKHDPVWLNVWANVFFLKIRVVSPRPCLC